MTFFGVPANDTGGEEVTITVTNQCDTFDEALSWAVGKVDALFDPTAVTVHLHPTAVFLDTGPDDDPTETWVVEACVTGRPKPGVTP